MTVLPTSSFPLPRRDLLALVLWILASPGLAQSGVGVLDPFLGSDELAVVPLDGSAAVPVGPLAVQEIFGLAFDLESTLYGVSAESDELLFVDPGTAAVASVGPLGVDVSGAGGLTFDPTGALWMVVGDALYTVDPATGQATLLGPLAGDLEVVGLSACADRLIAVTWASGGTTGLGIVDPVSLSVVQTSEHFPYSAPRAAGIEHLGDRIVTLENRVSPITPPPMSEGSFLLGLDPSGNLLTEDWLTYTHSIAFAVGPPSPRCGAAEVLEVPALGPLGVLSLALALALAATVRLAQRRRAA